MRRHLGPAVAAHGQHGDALGLGGVGQGCRCAGDAQALRSPARPSACACARTSARASEMRRAAKRGGQCGVAAAPRLGQMAHGNGAGSPRRLPAHRNRPSIGGDGAAGVDHRAGAGSARSGRRGPGAAPRRIRSRHRRSCAVRGQSRPPGCCGSGRRPAPLVRAVAAQAEDAVHADKARPLRQRRAVKAPAAPPHQRADGRDAVIGKARDRVRRLAIGGGIARAVLGKATGRAARTSRPARRAAPACRRNVPARQADELGRAGLNPVVAAEAA
jgi:hypothetical protein